MKASMKSIKRWVRVKKAAVVPVAIYALVSLLLGSPNVRAQSQGNITTYSRNYSITHESFTANSGDVLDGCIDPGGPYKLLRFDTVVPNKGDADIDMPEPPSEPGVTDNPIYEYSPGHSQILPGAHYHVRGFFTLNLLSSSGTPKSNGLKQGFCLNDIEQLDSNAPPLKKYDSCSSNQGIQPGWADVYDSYLPCQFVNITNVPDGTYRVFSTANASRIVPESNYHDNSFSDVITIAGDTVTEESPGWLGSQLIVPASLGPSRSSMSVVTRGGTRYDLFYRGSDNKLYTKWFDTFSWQPVTEALSLGEHTIKGAVSAVSWEFARIDVFARGTNNDLIHWYWAGGPWGAHSLGGSLGSDPKVVSAGPNRLDVVAIGTDGAMKHIRWDGSRWSPWSSLGGNFIKEQPAATAWALDRFDSDNRLVLNHRLDVFARGASSQAVKHKAFTAASGWSTFNTADGWENLGGALTSRLTAASWGPNRIDIFGRGPDNGLWRKAWAPGWSDWARLGTDNLLSAPEAISVGRSKLDVFYTTSIPSTGEIRLGKQSRDPSSGWTNTPIAITSSGGINASTRPVATSWAVNHLGIFVGMANGDIRLKAYF